LKKTGLFSEVKVYDTIPDILRDVNTGRLKAGFADYPILAYNLKQGGFPEVRLVESFKPTMVGTVAIGVRKPIRNCSRRSTPRSPSSRRMAPSTRFSTNGGSRQKPPDP